MGLRSEYNKVRKIVKKEVEDAVEAVKDVTNNILEGKEYRAEECFEVFKKHNIQMVSKQTGQEVTEWKDFGARIDREWKGDYDLDFCKKEFAEKGFVPIDEYTTAPLPTFDVNKCFELFSEHKKTLIYYKDKEDKLIQVTQHIFDVGCKNSEEPKKPFCDTLSSESTFTENYTLDSCGAEFAKANIFLLSSDQEEL